MSVKARTVSLTTTPVLLETPQKFMTIVFKAPNSDVTIGGSDLTSSTNGISPNDLPTRTVELNRGESLYAVTTANINLTYIAIGD